MSEIWLLMGLLLLSYIGSFLVSDHALRGYGLSSGAEYVVLGFLLGPVALGMVEGSMLEAFEPVANMALGWLALVVGLGFGFVGERRIRLARLMLGLGLSLAAGVAVAAVAWLVARRVLPSLGGRDLTMLAIGVGAASAETTRHGVTWVAERYRASGKLTSLIADLADSADLGPLLLMGVAFALAPAAEGAWTLPVYGWTTLTLAIGVALGAVAVVLLGSDFRLVQSWGVLLGTSLLTIGTAARFGLSPLIATFAMGATIAGASRHRNEVVAMVAPTERPVLLPVLLLAGAHLAPLQTPPLLWVAGAALAARVLAKLGTGLLVRTTCADARGTPPTLGLSLLSSGAVSISVGLAFVLRFPGPVGDAVLITAAAATVAGEFVGPPWLRSVLRRAGELAPGSARPARGAQPQAAPPGESAPEPASGSGSPDGEESSPQPGTWPSPEEGGQ